MKLLLFITLVISVYITFNLIFRIIYGLIHYDKRTYIILGLLVIGFNFNFIREIFFTYPALIFIILSSVFLGEAVYLIYDYFDFKLKKKKGYYTEFTGTIIEIDNRLAFVKHNLIFFGTYYFPHVSYKSNYFDTDYYSFKNGFKKDIYKINDSIVFYKDPSTRNIIEEQEKRNNVVLAKQFLVFGLFFLIIAMGIMGVFIV